MRYLLLGLLTLSSVLVEAQLRAVVPSQDSAHANHFYSPGVDAGDYVYISAQGPVIQTVVCRRLLPNNAAMHSTMSKPSSKPRV